MVERPLLLLVVTPMQGLHPVVIAYTAGIYARGECRMALGSLLLLLELLVLGLLPVGLCFAIVICACRACQAAVRAFQLFGDTLAQGSQTDMITFAVSAHAERASWLSRPWCSVGIAAARLPPL